MIVEIIFYMIDKVLGILGLLILWDGAPITQLPFGLDDKIAAGINGYKVLAKVFPPFNTVLAAFIIYLGFKIVLRLIKGVPIIGRMVEKN